MLSKKVLSIAVAGMLASGSAFAANLSADGGAVPAYFAQEIIAGPGADAVQLTTSASAATELNWNIGYSFSDGEVRYMRLECSNNLEFDSSTDVDTNAAGASIGSVNGLGTNVLTFSLTAGATPINATNTITVSGDHFITGTDQDVTCNTALYDQPSQAQAGGEVGRIQGTEFSGAYLSFVPSYELVNIGDYTNVAEVESDPAYSEFSPSESDAAVDPYWASLGQLRYSVRDPDGAGGQSAPFKIDGTEITLSDLFHDDTSITVVGDFSAYDFSDFYGGAQGTFAADGASVTYNVGSTGHFDACCGYVFVSKPADSVIQESEYRATLNAIPAAPTVYAVTDITGVWVGKVVRNGTQLQAPLVQRPNGWISRVVLTNTGNSERDYSIAVQGEEGNVIGTGTVAGTVGANSTVVLDVTDILTSFTGSARATLNVTVNAPDEQIQGLYQIVNADSGSISNHVMVRPGTN